ncbi:hypothetical protein EI42_03821 [Thermosporothrix hazakensis]|uniref:Uncharacterized protein n=1 Tax=Thermosporothrix hazakensis TaxID=644383 RepID=A0A326U3K2_THEHA|nr:hypothetical protein EI42_03821 [Thermosporothrix hazakensis]
MIGLVETGPLEDDSRRIQHSADMSTTLRADGQRFIGHFLPRFKTVATGLTEILVRWHIPITSLQSGHNNCLFFFSCLKEQ